VDTRSVQPLEPMQIAAFLQRVPGFERLSTRQLMRIADVVKEVRVGADELLAQEGGEETALFVLVEGSVELSSGSQPLGVLGPHSLLGELSSLDGGVRSESIRASENILALRLERSDLMALMAESPGLGIGLAQLLASRIRALHERLAGEQPT
jgi:CRP-like cAMP-binding protein